MHRLREWGFHDKILDLLDERKLSKGELRSFVSFLMGVEAWDVPDPAIDFQEFCIWVKANQQNLRPVFSVLKCETQPWINIKKLKQCYDPAGCTIS